MRRLDPRALSKVCPKCKEEKARDKFGPCKSRGDGLHSWCKRCMVLSSERYRKENPEWFEKNKKATYLRRYGLTPDDFDSMLAAQGGRCAICQSSPSKTRRLAVDHDHKTGKIRQLLCDNCNRGIGHLKDSVLILRSAIEYIERHSKEKES